MNNAVKKRKKSGLFCAAAGFAGAVKSLIFAFIFLTVSFSLYANLDVIVRGDNDQCAANSQQITFRVINWGPVAVPITSISVRWWVNETVGLQSSNSGGVNGGPYPAPGTWLN